MIIYTDKKIEDFSELVIDNLLLRLSYTIGHNTN